MIEYNCRKLRSRIMKNKKSIIIIIVLVMIIVSVAIILGIFLRDKFIIIINNEKINKNETNYTDYIDINPLIKLNFKVLCQNNVCNEPIVTDTELINEDAKEIYKNLVIKDKTLKETIELLTTTVKDNNIAFKEVHIYSNYDNKDYFNFESVDYEIILDVKEEKELEQVIDELIINEQQTKTKEIRIQYLYPKEVKERLFEFQSLKDDCTVFEFIEHPELYVSRGGIKVTISGPATLIDSLPNTVVGDDAFNFGVQAFVEVNDYSKGEHITSLNITSQNSNIKIVSPTSIKVKYEVIDEYSGHLCLYFD